MTSGVRLSAVPQQLVHLVPHPWVRDVERQQCRVQVRDGVQFSPAGGMSRSALAHWILTR